MTPHARKAERLRSIRVQEAYALLEKNPAFPAVRVEMYDKEKAFAEVVLVFWTQKGAFLR
jgi:hypothetical protein